MKNNDLYEYAENANVIIEYGNLQKNKALSVKIGQKEYIGVDLNVNSAEERTLIAHELGHIATGTFYDKNTPVLLRRRAEHKAVKWSLLHCVPKTELIPLLKQGYKTHEIADYFGVNEDLINTAYTYYFEYGVAV